MSVDAKNLKSGAFSAPEDESLNLKKELETQKEILLKIYEQTEKTRRYILLGKIVSLIYLILLVAPIIFAIIYLPPLIKNVIAPYQELLGIQPKAPANSDSQTINGLLKQFSK